MKIGRHMIGTRMGLGLGLIMVLMISLILLGTLSMRSIKEKMDAIINQNNKQIWYANVINDSVHSIDEAMLTLIQTKDDEWNNFEHVKILTARETYKDAVEKLEHLEDSVEGRRLVERLKAALAQAMDHNVRTADLTLNGRHREAAVAYLSDARTAVAALHQICSELVTFEEKKSNSRYSEAVNTYHAAYHLFIAIAAAMVLFAVTAAVILTRNITGPIRKGVEIANRLAEGDLDVQIHVTTKDETGQLLSAMKNMVERLKQTKELEHQLLQSQKLETVGRLAGGIAHDFNNMLNVVLGSAELIRMQPDLNRKTYDRCVTIEKAVARAAGFVKQILAFSRRQVLELKFVDLQQVVGDFEKMVRRMVGEHIEMVVHWGEDIPVVKADVAQINQVLLNLVVNAREAMPEGGRLSIDVSRMAVDPGFVLKHPGARSGDYVVISVQDTGVGISRDVLDNIFEPFFTTKASGTGLGLSVVYGIVRQHGGFLTVETDVGKGTDFRVYLPSAAAFAPQEMDDDSETRTVRGNGTILIVEDDEEVRTTASELLGILGYHVRLARDGLEGVDIFREHHRTIDLVLLDMVMPKMNGREAYLEMRKIDPSVRSLFVSGYSVGEALPDDPAAGIDAIQKPYTAADLSVRIKEILSRKSSLAA